VQGTSAGSNPKWLLFLLILIFFVYRFSYRFFYEFLPLNMAIGMKITERLSLENDGENTNPKSKLLKKYTYHKVGETQQHQS